MTFKINIGTTNDKQAKRKQVGIKLFLSLNKQHLLHRFIGSNTKPKTIFYMNAFAIVII